MTLIVGAEGRIGRRYQAIFKYLKAPFVPIDKETSRERMVDLALKADRILLCTPTDTHYELLKYLFTAKKPVLCEKPITRRVDQLVELQAIAERNAIDFKMVFQYKEIAHSKRLERSTYNYFNHGPDGLHWDAIQIIGLAKSSVFIEETSPIWICEINGEPVTFGAMDHAYIKMISKWLNNSLEQTTKEILNIHEKVADIINEQSQH